jgi:hypothetical protein
MATSWLLRGRAALCRPAMLLPRWPVRAVGATPVRYGVTVLGAGVVGASGVMMVARAEEEEDDGQRAVTEAEVQSAEQLLAEYFRTTEPAPGGRGAVRLRRELVSSDGQQGVAEYVQSLTTAAAADATAAGGRETAAQTGGQLDEPPPPRLPWSPTTLQQIRVKQAAFAQCVAWMTMMIVYFCAADRGPASAELDAAALCAWQGAGLGPVSHAPQHLVGASRRGWRACGDLPVER